MDEFMDGIWTGLLFMHSSALGFVEVEKLASR
jgi:hypothetical protein